MRHRRLCAAFGAVWAFWCNGDAVRDEGAVSRGPTGLVGVLSCEEECRYRLKGQGGLELEGIPIVVAENGKWTSLSACDPPTSVKGVDRSLGGKFEGWSVNMCSVSGKTPKLRLTIRNFKPSLVVFSYEYLADIYPGLENQNALLNSFPAFKLNGKGTSPLDGRLSWQGSFVQPDFQKCASGTQGGPCVLFPSNDPSHGSALVLSALDNFLTTSRGSGNADDVFPGRPGGPLNVVWAGGTVGSIRFVPKGFKHSFVAWLGSDGITDSVGGWGRVLRRFHATHRVPDITIDTLGYQTDNGAQYCFGCGDGCDSVLLDELEDLQGKGVPVRYLSYQNAWWHGSGSAPWCVSEWDAVPSKVPMGIPEFHRRASVPFQLYMPYMCTNSKYASMFATLSSNASLPTCDGFNFRTPAPPDSRRFYDWLFRLGKTYGMSSFELDFVNQNINCVDEFLTSLGAAEQVFDGLAGAALSQSVSVQWCYASPSAALQTLKYPVVTNMRGSFDYFYGGSWDIGGSSLLLWALEQAPSTDTFWTTDNGDVSDTMGGCDKKQGCPADHADPGCALHTLLALMSTGPVGFSDAKGYTNAARIRRTCRQDGVLLKPNKPATTMDAQLSIIGHRETHKLLHTYSGPNSSNVWAWYIVGHHLDKPRENGEYVQLGALWPRLDLENENASWLLRWDVVQDQDEGATETLSASYGPAADCLVEGGPIEKCAELVSAAAKTSILLPQTKSPFQPLLGTLVPLCQGGTGWAVLGEVRKMAALSTARFRSIFCEPRTTSRPLGGVSVEIQGASNETVTVVFAGPDLSGRETHSQRPNKIYVRTVTIPDGAGHARISVGNRGSKTTVQGQLVESK